jgi:hypothetical protein
MPATYTTPLWRQTRDARDAYNAQVKAVILENDEIVASTTGLILESRALLRRVDRRLRDSYSAD